MSQREFGEVFFPYCLHRLTDGRYIALNRQYKPLGISASDFVDYETHPSAAKIKITPAKAVKISYQGSENVERIYLYNDGCNPRLGGDHADAYFKRLATLMPLLVQTP